MAVQRKNTEPTIKDFAVDIVTIKGELEGIKTHMKQDKEDRGELKQLVNDIKSSLVGNNLNGNRGIVFLLNDIDIRVKHLEKSNSERQQTESNAKWVGGFIITAIFALMIWIVQHLPKAP